MATFLCNSIWTLGSALVRNNLTLIYTFILSTVCKGSEMRMIYDTARACLWVSACFCTQDAPPAFPGGSTPRVSQYACQRRTTTENNNKIFTVRKCFLTLLHTQLHFLILARQRLYNVKKPPNLFCSNWMDDSLGSPALWHSSPQNTLTCKWAASAAAARLRCNSWHAHDPWHGGGVWQRTRPEAPCDTPRWAIDVTLLSSNRGSVPLPSGWAGVWGREGQLREGHRIPGSS